MLTPRHVYHHPDVLTPGTFLTKTRRALTLYSYRQSHAACSNYLRGGRYNDPRCPTCTKRCEEQRTGLDSEVCAASLHLGDVYCDLVQFKPLSPVPLHSLRVLLC